MDQKQNVVVASMYARKKMAWGADEREKNRITNKKKQLRNMTFSAAAFLCLGLVVTGSMMGEDSISVTTEFEYDDTLGRLQFVSSMLPESAMVFMQDASETAAFLRPAAEAEETHGWSSQEPWVEYTCFGAMRACEDATVMNVVRNREQAYTVRLMHDGGYESVYSGLFDVDVQEGDSLVAGETVGYADGMASFELRQDGMSVRPVFAAAQ